MTQISRRFLRKDVQERVFELFLASLGKVRNKAQAADFVKDILSPTEQTMLAKRLSIAYLLSKGYDQRAISQVLKVGLATVSRVSSKLKNGGVGYRRVISQIEREESLKEFLGDLEGIVTALPPKGRNWSRWRKEKFKKELARRKAF